MEVFYLLLIIGLIFGSLGALMAYLITYKEWMHHYTSPKIPRRIALETAVFTLVFFIVVAMLVGAFVK